MIQEVVFLAYACFGAAVRTIYGIYSAYSNYEKFSLNFKRIAVEFLASTAFGLFGAMVLNELGFWKVGSNLIAIFAGLFGANLLNVLTKKIGVDRKLQVNVVEKLPYPDLSPNQVRAIEYLKSKNKITNKIYRVINKVSANEAKWDLSQLVKKGYLTKVGKKKGVYYKLRANLHKL